MWEGQGQGGVNRGVKDDYEECLGQMGRGGGRDGDRSQRRKNRAAVCYK